MSSTFIDTFCESVVADDMLGCLPRKRFRCGRKFAGYRSASVVLLAEIPRFQPGDLHRHEVEVFDHALVHVA